VGKPPLGKLGKTPLGKLGKPPLGKLGKPPPGSAGCAPAELDWQRTAVPSNPPAMLATRHLLLGRASLLSILYIDNSFLHLQSMHTSIRKAPDYIG
jgi:hypothetical protein